MNEEWRTIPGFEGRYEVSNLGRVRSLIDWQARPRTTPILKAQCQCNHGYKHVNLIRRRGARPKRHPVHTLVCWAFHGPRPRNHQGAHANGVRTDNRATNLRWATPTGNASDRDEHGKTVWGSRVNTSKLSADQVVAIRALAAMKTMTFAEIGEQFGVSHTAAWKVATRRDWARLP